MGGEQERTRCPYLQSLNFGREGEDKLCEVSPSNSFPSPPPHIQHSMGVSSEPSMGWSWPSCNLHPCSSSWMEVTAGRDTLVRGGGLAVPKSTHPKWGMRTRLSWLCHEEDVQEGAGRAGGHHALEKVLVEEEGTPGLVPGSSCQRFIHRRRAFMKKLLTVLSSKPSCCEMVICISLDGRLFSLKMAIRVRRWRSVKTSRCFLGCRLLSFCCSCSLRLQARRSKERTGPLIGADCPGLLARLPGCLPTSGPSFPPGNRLALCPQMPPSSSSLGLPTSSVSKAWGKPSTSRFPTSQISASAADPHARD